MSTASGVLEAIDRVLNRGGEAEEVLRQVVDSLHRLYPYVAIAFVEKGELAVGLEVGHTSRRPDAFPISFEGAQVAELRVAGTPADQDLLERIARLVSAYSAGHARA